MKRGLSREQVPIPVAAVQAGATVSVVLPAIATDAVGAVLASVMDNDALPVTEGCI